MSPKGHDSEFKVPVMGLEGCLMNVTLLHSDLMITCSQIQLENTLAPFNSSNKSSIMGIGNLSFTVLSFSLL